MDNKRQAGYDNHVFGQSVEAMFDQKCKELGLKCVKAHSSRPWDRVIHAANGIFKIQVKATRTLSRVNKGNRNYVWAYCVSGVRENKAKSPYAEDVDFMAIYVAPIAKWFVMPAKESTAKRLKIARNPEGRMLRARENWSYFTPGVDSRTTVIEPDGLALTLEAADRPLCG